MTQSIFQGFVARLLATLWLGISLCGAEPTPDWSTDNFFLETQAGLGQNSITAIVQTHDGYLWFGSYTGLLRFDGVRFTVFNSSNTGGLKNGRITKLFEDDSGVLWIAHETGDLTELRNGVFQPVEFKAAWPGGSIEEINMDAQSDIWLLNGNGSVYRLRDGLLLSDGLPRIKTAPATLIRDDKRQLWSVFNGTVSTIQNDRLIPFHFDDGEQTIFYGLISPSRDGGLWVTRNGIIRKWLDGKWTEDFGNPWGADSPTPLVETHSRILLAGTVKNGLFMFSSGAPPLVFNRANGLAHDWVRALCEDREGNIWIGTGGGGVSVLRARRAKMFSAPDSWQGRTVLPLVINQNEAWIGTEGAGLYHYDLLKKNWKVFGDTDGLSNSFVWSVLQTKRGELFAGTWDGGIFLRKGERFERPDALLNITAPVTALYEGSDEALWIGTGAGLHKFENGKLAWFAGGEKLILPDVRSITQSRDGTIWFGMVGGGLGRLKNGELKQFQKKDGVGSDVVNSLFAETNNTLWIGTGDNGLCRLKDGKFFTINSDQDLPNNVICSIAEDDAANFWLGTHGGIVRVSKSELERCADGLAKSVQALTFGTSDGLASEICSGGLQPGVARDSHGLLWFPTAKGIALVNPAKVRMNPLLPPVIIEKFIVEGQPVGHKTVYEIGSKPTASALKISPGNQRFEVHYTALSFTAPDKVRFKYKLEKLESDWVDAEQNRFVQFSYLPPGSYSFRVIACNNDGLWNETGASFAFIVLPYFWQTLWFRIAMLAGGAVVIGLSVLWTTRRRLHHKMELLERQRAIERERTRIARDIHDDLGASLTRITMLSESVRGELKGPAAADANQVYRTAREMTRALDEIVWAVNPKHDSLDSLANYLGRFAQSFLTVARLRCRLDLPLHLPTWTLSAEIRHNVFLAFKEALNNVVKHAAATEVQISMELKKNGFLLCVDDNGRGFDLETLKLTDENHGTSGNGILNMQKRLEEIGGRCDWESSPGNGTTVKLLVSLKSTATRH